MLRRIIAFVLAAALMIVLGSAAHSYFVQRAWANAAGLADAGPPATIPFSDRIAWAAHDLFGMLLSYGAVTSITLLIAFLLAGRLARIGGRRTWIFAVAGAAAIWVLFTTLRLAVGTVAIFGARGPLGLGVQMLVGLLAGLLYARLTAPRAVSR